MATSDITLEKSLPHSLEAEGAVLGAVLLDNQVFDQAAELLTVQDFHSEGHQKIFARMEALASMSRPIDLVTLREELDKDNQLETVGGVSYLASLLDGVPRIANIERYAQIVKEKSILRKLIHTNNEILIRCFSGEEDPASLLEQAEKSIFEISQERINTGFTGLRELLEKTWKHVETLEERKELITGVPTGYHQLDEMTSGLQPSDLVILAGRPGMGKTSLALNIGQHASIKEGKTVGVFSLEMASDQLVMRLLCGEARVDSHRVRSGYLSSDDWQDLAKAMSRLSEARIFIDDTPAMSIIEMRSKSRRLKSEHGLDLLIIDYMQLMSGTTGRPQRFENRQQEISAISRALKALAKELSVPVLALSQLSRAPEQRRGDHRPQLSDLRESGSIEQDADVVLFVFREDLYRKDEEEEDTGIAEVIIGKQRNGPTGVVKLAFIDQWTRFENPAANQL
jgi:replicative DNA helicase